MAAFTTGFQIILFVMAAATLSEQCCPNGWTRFGNSCYYFSTAAGMHVTEARNYCIQRGAHLVTVETAIEEAFLKEYISHLKGENFWLDITDELVEGVWTWQSAGRPATYTDWGPTEPNSYQGANEDCAVFSTGVNFQWADVPCSLNFRPLCEQKLNMTEQFEVVG